MTIKGVYRRLATALHPDRSTGPADAKRRTVLMQRANRAKDAGDLQALMALQAEVLGPPPVPETPRLPRATDINIWTLRRAVLTDEGWVCPP